MFFIHYSWLLAGTHESDGSSDPKLFAANFSVSQNSLVELNVALWSSALAAVVNL